MDEERINDGQVPPVSGPAEERRVYPTPEIEPTNEIYPQPQVEPSRGFEPNPQGFGPSAQFPPPGYGAPQGNPGQQAPPPYPPYQQPYPGVETKREGGTDQAVASMILGILSLIFACCVPVIPLVCAIISIVFAVVVIKEERPGKGMAIAGLVCSVCTLLLGSVVLFAVLRSLFSGGVHYYFRGIDDIRDFF
ncbi:MAG: DUF4190 domain-containing protein [Lachnospiraceae bacterium]|nr:DUF4190 domain-containing protein [Lachnospiraceae bacterium]